MPGLVVVQPVSDVHAEGTDKPGFAAEYSIWDFT